MATYIMKKDDNTKSKSNRVTIFLFLTFTISFFVICTPIVTWSVGSVLIENKTNQHIREIKSDFGELDIEILNIPPLSLVLISMDVTKSGNIHFQIPEKFNKEKLDIGFSFQTEHNTEAGLLIREEKSSIFGRCTSAAWYLKWLVGEQKKCEHFVRKEESARISSILFCRKTHPTPTNLQFDCSGI